MPFPSPFPGASLGIFLLRVAAAATGKRVLPRRPASPIRIVLVFVFVLFRPILEEAAASLVRRNRRRCDHREHAPPRKGRVFRDVLR